MSPTPSTELAIAAVSAFETLRQRCGAVSPSVAVWDQLSWSSDAESHSSSSIADSHSSSSDVRFCHLRRRLSSD
ncbi:hypothetical protein AAHA92_02651 [Salvia divinorum]|uniref:Uncharacterized protein n=1 Tax=Salvia divinorum TaxID=28513 RepID=A0ABD1IFM1_SALDI